MDLHQQQLHLEEQYSTASIAAGQKMVLDALTQGRATDIGAGRILLAKAFANSIDDFQAVLSKPMTGVGGKYKQLLMVADPEVLVMAGLREIINGCASPEPIAMQKFLTNLGKVIESETMLVNMDSVSQQYTDRTVEYLDTTGTKSTHHRYRTFLRGAETLQIAWEQWSGDERMGAAKLLTNVLYESTGLFKWEIQGASKSSAMYFLTPSDTLAKHFEEIQAAAKAIVRYPPMLIPPMAWQGQMDGGYLTDWFRANAPMCGIRYIQSDHKKWIVNGLCAPEAQPVRDAMTKAQSVPYKVNKDVLRILRAATATRRGILGLPSFIEAPKPEFPLHEDWQKAEATVSELEQFAFWKQQMAAWYTGETKRRGRQMGILSRINELVKYESESNLYFPTFIDWRGRLYFRSNLNPQSSDAVKGCIDFAEGKPLGERGLKWLKAYVANQCGFDKHGIDVKEKWCDEHWSEIQDFINNPLDVDAPESDTAFTLLQAGLALQDALNSPNPEAYICHVPIAMDATCSGLQHLSALTRDEVGGYYTNLIDNGADKKSDIYTRVAEVASEGTPSITDPVIKDFWSNQEITRTMAKKPVMTYVYGATLLTCIDGLALNLAEMGVEPIKDNDKVIYSTTALATPIGKALRKGVEDTVPRCAAMMKYLQKLVRKYPDTTMRWLSPVGVPVVNWAEGTVIKRLNIRSMGVTAIRSKVGDKQYNTRIAANGVVPNFVHSNDAAHLCLTINDFKGRILPIHDSFATHASDVDSMHVSLRSTFIKMYTDYNMARTLEFNDVDLEEYPLPSNGALDLEVIVNAPFMFS